MINSMIPDTRSDSLVMFSAHAHALPKGGHYSPVNNVRGGGGGGALFTPTMVLTFEISGWNGF